MSDTAIVMSGSSALMPAMDMGQAQLAYQAMVDFVKGIMKEETDFGIIPGTTKPTLYKPGAEKLTRFFGLAARFEITKEIEQWGGEEPFFYYRYKCILSRLADGVLIAESEGSCNSHEKKYRYRNADRVCPSCGKTAIIKGKKEYGGGWLCYGKKGGCGTKFPDDHFSGEVEQVLNPDICDLVNTIQKMAQKRALIAATLIACNASEYFTQDVEDLDYGVQVVTVVPESAPTDVSPEQSKQAAVPVPNHRKRPMEPQALREFIVAQAMGDNEPCVPERAKKLAIKWGNILHHNEATRRAVAHWLLDWPQDEPIDSFKQLNAKEVDVLDRWLTSDPPSAREEAAAIVALLFTEPKEASQETPDEQESIMDEAFPRDEHGNPIEDVA